MRDLGHSASSLLADVQAYLLVVQTCQDGCMVFSCMSYMSYMSHPRDFTCKQQFMILFIDKNYLLLNGT